MTCNELFYAGIGHITDAYKRVCIYNEELHEDLEKAREENEKLRELLSAYWKRTHSPAVPNVERDWLSEMRKLGVES